MVIAGWTLLVMVVVTGIYVLLKLSAWGAAPLAGTLGVVILVLATHLASPRGMLFGAGLFAFSAALFVLGGGMRDR